ncbi:MAG: hypothetical protein RR980_00960 [Mucinivorans sp.]
MKSATTILSSLVLSLILSACVDKNYDLEKINDVNTDINFGGEYLALPLGSLSNITLGRFIKPSDMLSAIDGKYEFRYNGTQNVAVPQINPISIATTVPPINPAIVDFSKMSINSIDLPVVKLAGTASSPAIPSGGAGLPITLSNIKSDGTSPVNIGYTFEEPVKRIFWVSFGAHSSGAGELLSLKLMPDYAGTLQADQRTTINKFELTFPYGFQLALPANNKYDAKLSNDNKTITITNKLFQGDNIEFLIRKVTFNPSIDQTVPGNLDYNAPIKYSCDFSVAGTSSGTGGVVKIKFEATKKLTLDDGFFATNVFANTIEKNSATISVNEPFNTPELKSLSSIVLSKASMMTIKIDIKGLPTPIKSISLNDYRIKFPDFLVFKDPTLNRTRELVLNDQIDPIKGLTKTIEVTGFKFTVNPIMGNIIKASGDIVMGGGFKVPAAELKSSEINEISLVPNATIEQMNVATISGIIDPDIKIDPFDVNIDLGADLDFLENSTLDLSQVIIKLQATNPTGMAAEIGFTINPYDKDNKLITQGAVNQLSGMVIQPTAISNIWLSNSDKGKPGNFVYVENKDMPKLFRQMPKRIAVIMYANTDKYESTIKLDEQPTALKLDYDIVAPLGVGSEFELLYSEKITNLHKDLSDFLGYITTLTINANIDNNIPLELLLAATPLDAQGKPIGVTIDVDGTVAAGTKDGAFVTSKIALTLKEATKGELSKLDQIKFNFTGQSNAAIQGAALRDDQSLKVKLSAKVPGGINIKDTK